MISSDAFENVFIASISIGAIAIGFLGTSKSILVALESKKIIQYVKEAGLYGDLIDYFMAAIRWAFMLVVISLFSILMDVKDVESDKLLKVILFSIWLFVFMVGGFSHYRIISIFSKILKFKDPKES